MKIYFVRHGETESNVNKTATGQGDSPLTQKGIEDAEATAQELPLDFDIIYSSDIGRTKITTAILNKRLNLPVIYDERLRERHFGTLEGKTLSIIDPELYKKDHRQEYNYQPYGGESVEDVRIRLFNFIDEIRETQSDKKILIVTHGGIIRLLHHLLKGKVPEMIHHAYVHEFDFPNN